MVAIKSKAELDRMRESCRIVAVVLESLGELIAPGISTWELNEKAEDIISIYGAEAAFKNYRMNGLDPYLFSICASVNDEIVHGYSSKEKILQEGDIIGIDVGVKKDGFYGDGAKTFAVGKVDIETQKLMVATELALTRAIEQCYPGNRVGDISFVIEKTARENHLFVAEGLTGHGVGRKLHEEPMVPNIGEKGRGQRLLPGMTIAIEPMFNLGTSKVIEDGWVFRTVDGSNSAHFEHTVLITENEPEILTKKA